MSWVASIQQMGAEMGAKERKKKFKEMADGLVTSLDSIFTQMVNEEVSSRLDRLKPGGGGNVIARARPVMTKICPAPRCKKTGSPRHRMLCIEHSEKYNAKEADGLRFDARQPGGKWYVEPKKQAKKQAAG